MKTRILLLLPALLILAAPLGAAEIGGDVRLSFMGVDGDATVDAKTPTSAYNPYDNEILMVWSADYVDGHFQIWGQRIHAPTGALAGAPFQISFTDDPIHDDIEPAVVFNLVSFQYLVVWSSDVIQDGAEEIHGQRVNRYGELIGDRGFRISDMGNSDDDTAFDANEPAVCWNSVDNEFMVAWSGDDDAAGNGEIGLFVQRLSSNGAEVGINDQATAFYVAGYDFPDPAIAHNSTDNQYLLISEAIRPGDSGPEIAGLLLDAAGATLTPGGLFMSAMGTGPTDTKHANNPDMLYDPVSHQYLVVWDGDHVVDEEFEIYARWFEPAGGTPVTDQIRMSDMGNDGTYGAEALHPSLAHNTNDNTFLVTWHGDDYPGLTQLSEPEVFGQEFDAALAEFGPNDFRLSSMGFDPSSPHEAASSTAQYNPNQNLYLVGWSGDDDVDAMVPGEEEVHIQRYGINATSTPDQPGPRRFALHANVPNPFNPSTTIYFDVPEGAPSVTLRIYDVSGRLVRTLVQGRLDGGKHAIMWQGRDNSGASVASGVYHLRMEAGDFRSSRKLALVQ